MEEDLLTRNRRIGISFRWVVFVAENLYQDFRQPFPVVCQPLFGPERGPITSPGLAMVGLDRKNIH